VKFFFLLPESLLKAIGEEKFQEKNIAGFLHNTCHSNLLVDIFKITYEP